MANWLILYVGIGVICGYRFLRFVGTLKASDIEVIARGVPGLASDEEMAGAMKALFTPKVAVPMGLVFLVFWPLFMTVYLVGRLSRGGAK